MPTAWKNLRHRTKSSGFRAVIACVSKPSHREPWITAAELSAEIGLSETMIAEYTAKNMVSHLPGTEPHYRVSQVVSELEAIEAQSLILQPAAFVKIALSGSEQASA